MRLINVTIEIPDEDHIESNLYKTLNGILGEHLKDYVKLPDTKELYDNDPNFREICKEYKKIKKIKNDYINSKK